MKKQSASDFEIYVDPSCSPDPEDIGRSTIGTSADPVVIHQDNSEDREVRRSGNFQSQNQEDRTETLIQSAARALAESIERDKSLGLEDSVLGKQTDRHYDSGSGMYEGSTEFIYDSGAAMYESDIHDWNNEAEGGDSATSHNDDGDIDDDIFSRKSGQSARSSLNSIHDLHGPDELSHEKHSPGDAMDPISRIPSVSSYSYNPEVPTSPPNKSATRPPFRTPSSVRAMQMSSPTPSIFSSPRSIKRSSASRLGTPTTQKFPSSPTSRSKTPNRLKVKKEYPLVLLHVTVFPLQWPYANIIGSQDIPTSLYGVRDSWRLLQEKLQDTVLERGILLPHPQDSYEVLEERLLEALELPVQPRARILKCGHYMGPLDNEFEGSGDDMEGDFLESVDRKWCDICCREVKYMNQDPEALNKRFRIKIYASNGLMRAGAWAAVWKEMERVDVEIEPYVEPELLDDLERLVQKAKAKNGHHGGFEDIDEDAKRADEERMREMYGALPAIENTPQMESGPGSVPPPNAPHMESPPSSVPPSHPQPASKSDVPLAGGHTKKAYGDSLPELMLAALKVAIRDPKNIIICALSFVLLLLVLRPGPLLSRSTPTVMSHTQVPHVIGGLEHTAVRYVENEELVEEPAVTIAVKVPKAKPIIQNPSEQQIPEVDAQVEEPQMVQETEVVEEKDVEVEKTDATVEKPVDDQETEEAVIEEPLDTSEAETTIDEAQGIPEVETVIEETQGAPELEEIVEEAAEAPEPETVIESSSEVEEAEETEFPPEEPLDVLEIDEIEAVDAVNDIASVVEEAEVVESPTEEEITISAEITDEVPSNEEQVFNAVDVGMEKIPLSEEERALLCS
ncbi:hypothetical protein F5884DRAFT_5853 [Xylogone sp. PMI_703]|nr:hypothetical protein F5884DRAFT_5853 [Xylogone sp. PMI_703]